MDGDPAVEPEIDGFSRVLPLPYRVALIIVLGTTISYPPQTTSSLFYPSRITLTPPHRHLGLGSQLALPLPYKNRRPESNPLPEPQLTPPPFPSPLLLPHRNLSLYTTRALAPPVLGPYKRIPKGHRGLGNPPELVPPCPRHRIHRAHTIRFTKREE